MAAQPKPARDDASSKMARAAGSVNTGGVAECTQTSSTSEPLERTVVAEFRNPTFEPLLKPGDVLDGRFAIVKLLGAGGMGEVYEAEDLDLHRDRVAVKTIRADYAARHTALERFKDEVLLARDIAHPNVCPVREIFSCEGPRGEIWFLTMKLLEGETLGARLKGGPLGADAAVRVAREIGAGLDAIHEVGIVHRDLKPSNVFLETYRTGERAVVMDFGIAHASAEDSSETATAHVAGTPSYMAPEVLTGRPATVRSDVYSFGVVLHEMLIGRRPDSATTLDLRAKSEDARTRRLRAVIAQCLASDPARRFASAGEVAAALEAAYEEPGLITRRRLLVGGAAALVAGSGWLERDEIYRWLHPIPRPRRVAVLPAQDAHLSSEDAALLGGVLETVSGELARMESVERDLFVLRQRYIREQNVTNRADVLGLFGPNLVLSASLERLRDSVSLLLRLEGAAGNLFRRAKVDCTVERLYALPRLAVDRAAELLDIAYKGPPPPVGDTRNPEAYAAYERGRGLLRGFGLPNVEKAIGELQKAVELDPHFAKAWAMLTDAYATQYHLTNDIAALDLAERSSGKPLELAPELSQGYESRGRVELYRGVIDAAIKDLQRALELDPGNGDAQTFLAEAYIRAGKLDLADRTYEQASKDRPNDWFSLNAWGDFSFSQARYERAERLFREATMLAPQAALPWRNLGAVYLATERFEEADTALKRSIDLLPSGYAYTNLGTALFWQGKYRQAADSYLKATRLDPQQHMMWRNLGDAYEMIGVHEKARAAWRKAADLARGAVNMNPNNVDALTSLALYEAKLGERQAALELLARTSKAPALTVEQLFVEVLAYERAGNRTAALRMLRECVQGGYSQFDILHAPELQDLRKDARFKSLGVKAERV